MKSVPNRLFLKTPPALLLLFCTGLLIRIALVGTYDSPDAWSFVVWARYLSLHSMAELYTDLPGKFLTYPPGYYYILMPLGWIFNLFNLWRLPWLTLVLVKLPVFSAEIVVTYIIYQFSKTNLDKKQAIYASVFFYLNPAIIYVSAVWGQIDLLVMTLALVSVYLFLQKRYFASWLLYMFSVLTKLHALAMLPLMLLLSISHIPLKRLFGYGISLLLFIVLLFLPVIIERGVSWTVSYFAAMPHQYPYTSVYTYNLWAPLGFLVSDKQEILPLLNLRNLGILLFWLVALIILLPLFDKRRRTPLTIMFGAFLLFFDFTYFPTRIHSRYLIYALGFFAPFFPLFPISGVLLTVLMLANLLLPTPYFAFEPISQILNKPNVVTAISFLTFTLFVWMYKCYLKILRH